MSRAEKRKICIFTGTRADFGLLEPLIQLVGQSELLELQIIASGTHLSPEFGCTVEVIKEAGFSIDFEVEILLSSDSNVGVAKSMGLGVLGFADALNKLRPEVIVILGDRYEALAAAQVALVFGVPILHIHGGERTDGAIDDSIRHAISKLSNVHCTATEAYRQRVIQLGEQPSHVFNFGAVGLDQLAMIDFLTKEQTKEALGIEQNQDYLLVTYHPVTAGDENPVETARELTSALQRVIEAGKQSIVITYPNSDTGGRSIIPVLEKFKAENAKRVSLRKSLGQKLYLSAVKHSRLVVGNSSSGLIEVPSLGVRTVNIGMRQHGRLAAPSVLNTGVTQGEIFDAIRSSLSKTKAEDNTDFRNPYGKPGASEKIAALLETFEFNHYKTFNDLNWVQEHDTDHR